MSNLRTFDFPSHLFADLKELNIIPEGIYAVDEMGNAPRYTYLMKEWHDDVAFPTCLRRVLSDIKLGQFNHSWSDGDMGFVMVFDAEPEEEGGWRSTLRLVKASPDKRPLKLSGNMVEIPMDTDHV